MPIKIAVRALIKNIQIKTQDKELTTAPPTIPKVNKQKIAIIRLMLSRTQACVFDLIFVLKINNTAITKKQMTSIVDFTLRNAALKREEATLITSLVPID